MRRQVYVIRAAAAIAVLIGSAPVGAQTDTTRQVTSERRIPVRKDQSTFTGLRTSGGDVTMMSIERARIDALVTAAEADRARLQTLEAQLSSLTSSSAAAAAAATARTDELGRSMTDSLRAVRGELANANTRVVALTDSIVILDQRIDRLNQRLGVRSAFGNSGLFIGLGSGSNFTTGTLDEIGYSTGLNVVVPIGWHKRGTAFGFRGELGVETFDGRTFGGFNNTDPKAYSAVGMLTFHIPINRARSNFYLMGGGGAYMFTDIEPATTISGRLGSNPSTGAIRNETKFGITGGAGLEVHMFGAASAFIQSRLTNLMADAPAGTTGTSTSKNLRWIPLTLGFQIR